MTDPVWDVVFGVHGFRAILLAHKLKVFPLLANRPHLFEKRMAELASVALRNCIDLSCDQWIAGISPLKGSSFFVVYGDEVHELFNQLLPGFENPAPDHFSG